MTVRMFRVGLSFIVALGCWIGRVQAQAPTENPVVRAPATVIHIQSAPVTGSADGRMRDLLHRCGYACGQNLNWYGCGGWHAQNTFVFGSCRTFFGEPCMPNQPRGARHGGGTGH